jgi:hypothetical protein
MKIVIVSDSHRDSDVLERIVLMNRADYYLHAGDSCVPEMLLDPFLAVKGNCDFYHYPLERLVQTGNVLIYLHHGHAYPLSQMIPRAKSFGCQVVIFGHTHVPMVKVIDGIVVVNPGSVSFPRGGHAKSYAIMTFDTPQNIECTIMQV